MLGLAAEAVEELSKDSPSSEMVEYKTKDFVKTVEVMWTQWHKEIEVFYLRNLLRQTLYQTSLR